MVPENMLHICRVEKSVAVAMGLGACKIVEIKAQG